MVAIAIAAVTPAFIMTYSGALKTNERWRFYDLWAKGLSPLEADPSAVKVT
jgi:hypothetical protein